MLFPAGSIAAASAERDGVLLGLDELYELAPVTGGSVSYLSSFAEATDLVPFTVDAAEPGDVVARLSFTLAADAPAGPLPLTLDAATTALSNQAGTVDELESEGNLVLAHGEITVQNNAALYLLATADSANAIHLSWADPAANELGFRVERSQDGASWTPIGNVGPDDQYYLDSAGLSPGTFYVYRLVTLIAEGDSQISNPAAATTFASQTAKVCTSRVSGPRSRVRFPAVAWSGGEWAVVSPLYEGDQQGDLYFQRLSSVDLAPVGSQVRLTATDAASQYPTLRWNGSHYGLHWYEGLRGEPESPDGRNMFALLDAAGNKLRGDVPLPTPTGLAQRVAGACARLGRHPLGFFNAEWNNAPFSHVVYYRLTESGDTVVGPVDITTTERQARETEIAAAFAPPSASTAWPGSGTSMALSRSGSSASRSRTAPSRADRRCSAPSPGTTDGLAIVWNPARSTGRSLDGPLERVPLRRESRSRSCCAWSPPTAACSGPIRCASPTTSPIRTTRPSTRRPSPRWAPAASSASLSFGRTTWVYEIGLVRADAAGNRLGSQIDVTPSDELHSTYPRVASDGDRQVVVFNDGGTSGTQEIAAVLVDAAANPGALVPLSSGQSPGNSWTNVARVPRPSRHSARAS